MKKLLFSAVMALVLGCFISCTPRVSTGQEPQKDEANSTVNGKFYDNTVYKCWKFTWETTEKATGEPDERNSGVYYWWLTEFNAQYQKALWLYSNNVSASAYGVGASVSGTCTMEEAKDKDENSCYSDED